MIEPGRKKEESGGGTPVPDVIWLVLLALVTICWWFPSITRNTPYLYLEDEAHHFNRVLEMAKSGDLNPHYFHKPSLHFYLRLPAVHAAAWLLRQKGELGSYSEIVTRDPFGLATYAYSASHPLLLHVTRGVSVVLAVLTVLLTFLIARRLAVTASAAVVAALLVAVSPEFSKNASIVGVDTLMACMTLASVLAAVVCSQRFSRAHLILCGVFAGLAVSSKYNAAPIAILPLVLLWQTGRLERRNSLIALIVPPLAFLAGTPYLLISFWEFIRQVRYEVWHYSVAGHEGHSAEPGIQQAIFYVRWLLSDGVGYIAALLAIAGLSISVRTRSLAVLWFFPVSYALLMIAQKTNFTRNMVVVVPFVALLAALGARRVTVGAAVVFVLLSACLVQPLFSSYTEMRAVSSCESRHAVEPWINANYRNGDVAVDGELQLTMRTRRLPGVDGLPREEMVPSSLLAQGFRTFIIGTELEPAFREKRCLLEVRRFGGAPVLERVVRNPEIVVLRTEVGPEKLVQCAGTDSPLLDLVALADRCPREKEGYCWLTKSVYRISSGGRAEFAMMTPWANQVVSLVSGNRVRQLHENPLVPGIWQNVSLVLDSSSEQTYLVIDRTHSPAAHAISGDSRRLGVAVRNVVVR